MGLLTGIGFHLAGRWLFARTTSASIRLLIGLLFMGPAGAAGLGAGTALADLLGIDGGLRTCPALLDGVESDALEPGLDKASSRASNDGDSPVRRIGKRREEVCQREVQYVENKSDARA